MFPQSAFRFPNASLVVEQKNSASEFLKRSWSGNCETTSQQQNEREIAILAVRWFCWRQRLSGDNKFPARASPRQSITDHTGATVNHRLLPTVVYRHKQRRAAANHRSSLAAGCQSQISNWWGVYEVVVCACWRFFWKWRRKRTKPSANKPNTSAYSSGSGMMVP